MTFKGNLRRLKRQSYSVNFFFKLRPYFGYQKQGNVSIRNIETVLTERKNVSQVLERIIVTESLISSLV